MDVLIEKYVLNFRNLKSITNVRLVELHIKSMFNIAFGIMRMMYITIMISFSITFKVL